MRQARDLEKRFENTGKVFKNVGDIFSNVGGSLTNTITLPVAGVAAATGKMALDFEDHIAKVSTIADGAKVPIGEMREAILGLSNETGIAASEIADNVYDAISAGQDTADAVNFVSNSTKLARAGFADAASALDILTTTLNAYGMEAGEVTRVSDVLIQTQNLGKTTVGELSSAMGKVIPTAKANGVVLEQVAAGYAIMTANGIATAETTTYMNSMFNELGKSGTKVSEALKEKTGKSFKSLMDEGSTLSEVLQTVSDSAEAQGVAFTDLWGSAEAGKAALTILGDGVDTFNGVLGEMGNAGGATETAFEKLETRSFSVEKTLNMVKNTGIELGGTILEMLSPAIETASERVGQFSEWFHALDEDTKKTIVKVAGIAAAVGPLALGIGRVSSSIGGFITGIGKLGGGLVKIKGWFAVLGGSTGGFAAKLGGLLVKLGPVGLALAGIAGVGILVYKNFDQVRAYTQKLADRFKSLAKESGISLGGMKRELSSLRDKVGVIAEKTGEKIRLIMEAARPVLDFLGGAFKVGAVEAFKVLEDVLKDTVGSIKTIFGGLGKVLDGVILLLDGDFRGGFGKIFAGAGEILKGSLSGMLGFTRAPLDLLKNLFKKAFGAISKMKVFDGLKKEFPAIGDKIKSLMGRLESIAGKMKTVASKIKAFASGAGAGIRSAASGAAKGISGAVSGIKKHLSEFRAAIKPVTDVLEKVFKATVKSVFEAAKKSVEDALDAIGTILDGFEGVLDGVILFLDGDFKGGFKKVFEGLGTIVEGAMSGVVGFVKTPLNAVINLVNKAIDGINQVKVKIPDNVPLVGGVGLGFNIPHIPNLYTGTDSWKGGIAAISEPRYGGEIVDLPKGTRVYPHDESVRLARQEGSRNISITIPRLADTVVVREDADIDRIVDRLVERLLRVEADMP